MTNLTIDRLTLTLKPSGLSQPERQHLSQGDGYAALRDRRSPLDWVAQPKTQHWNSPGGWVRTATAWSNHGRKTAIAMWKRGRSCQSLNYIVSTNRPTPLLIRHPTQALASAKQPQVPVPLAQIHVS